VNTIHFLTLAGSSLSIFRFFRRLGFFGLFLFSVLDSSFLVLPFGNDLLLIGLTSADRNGLGWIGYVIAASAGSVLGVLLVDVLMRKSGEKGLQRFVSSKTADQLKAKIEKRAGVTVFITSLLPPPFPFTPVIMTASALQYPRLNLLGSVLAGRLVRYTVEAILALYFGRKLIRYINSDKFAYFVYVLIGIALVASIVSILKWFSQRRNAALQNPA
jgi:membrane protein YqaA with SNARE-associated domain